MEVSSAYRPKTARITVDLNSSASAATIERFCTDRQAEMLAWLDGATDDKTCLAPKFDGTIGSLIDCYESDPDSAYTEVKENTAEGYRPWLKMLRETIGKRRVDRVVAKDVRRWYREWRRISNRRGTDGTRQAYGGIQALRIVLNHGIEAGIAACRQLRADLDRMRFSRNPSRDKTMSFAQADSFIDEALRLGKKSMALCQALQFDCGLRQNYVRGEWKKAPAGYVPQPGEIVARDKVWRGMTMDMISLTRDLIVKTSKTGQPVVHALGACQLVIKVLNTISEQERVGPVARQDDGSPWPDRQSFARDWREIATAAGIPKDVWNMDNRASAISEAAEAGVPDDDIVKQSGHADKAIARAVYKRRGSEISKRSQEARRRLRDKQSSGAAA